MAKSLEEENRELKEKNNGLVQKIQYWKMTAAQREEEKLDLMKELNQLRLTMSHYRNSSAALDSTLDSAIQEFGENTLTKLVEVSSTITHTIEAMKSHIHKKQAAERASSYNKMSLPESPRDRTSNKVLRVVPMIRGRSIGKPIILLHQIDAAAHGTQQDHIDNNQEAEQVQPPAQHVLPDVYIPLRRIDADIVDSVNVTQRSRSTAPPTDQEELDNSAINESQQRMNGESAVMLEEAAQLLNGDADEAASESEDEFTNRRDMETLLEEIEDENWSPKVILSRSLPRSRSARYSDPLEGPSWMYDSASPIISAKTVSRVKKTASPNKPEPDSTTDNTQAQPAPVSPVTPFSHNLTSSQNMSSDSPEARVHTPTRRVGKKQTRVSSPLLENMWTNQDLASTGRENNIRKDPTKVLVMVAKMRMEDVPWSSLQTPQRKRLLLLEAPSPNGSTNDAGPIVMESPEIIEDMSEAENLERESTEQTEQTRSRDRSQSRSNRNSRERSQSHDRTKQSNLNENNSKQSTENSKEKRKTTKKKLQKREHSNNSNEESSSSVPNMTCEVDSNERSKTDSESDTNSERSGRAKRPRKAPPNYKEKPLNRKLRR